ncbi:DUF2510 domain-containing protein [Streptomyces sp. MH13]|uniref:DUF2510 domain-containing protein n=1 Tax=unclassified Streptomyces TaxID=2593676 RepID=UPI003CE7558A
MTPPPGWYHDPSAPHQERWWDGTAWTEHRRPPGTAGYGAPAPPHQQPSHRTQPGGPPTVPFVTGDGPAQRRPDGGTGRRKAVALVATAAVLVAAAVTGVLVLGEGEGEGDGGDAGAQDPPATAVSTGPPPASTSPAPSAPSADDPAVVEDPLNGITFPLPDGWVRPKHIAQDDVMMATDGTYDCPAGGGVCRHGLVISRTVTANAESSPQAIAQQDVEDAADDAYDRDPVGNKPFGGIESHEEVASGPVAVAGRAGYYVRWRVTTAEGPGGYVQSLVFPSTVGTESPVLVRYVFDAGEDGPPLDGMDRITKGIRPVGDAATGGGVGSGIGPSH